MHLPCQQGDEQPEATGVGQQAEDVGQLADVGGRRHSRPDI